MYTRVVLPRLLALGGPRVDGHLEHRVEVAPQLTDKKFQFMYWESKKTSCTYRSCGWRHGSSTREIFMMGAREICRLSKLWQQPRYF